MTATRICSVEGCGKRELARGLCSVHYGRWYRHGDSLKGRTPEGEPANFLRDVVLADKRGPNEPCLIWPYGRGADGYGLIWLDGRLQRVHRRVCQEAHGEPPTPDHDAAHNCGRGSQGCCTQSHVTWKTHAENMADRIIHGTSNRGESNGQAKLVESEVLAIRRMGGRLTQCEIGQMFGVHTETVGKIHRRETWNWL